MRGQQDKEIEMPTTTTLGYNLLPNRDSSSSSKQSPPPPPPPPSSDQPAAQTHTLIFNDNTQTSHHHHLYPSPPPSLPPKQLHQSQKPTTDPDPSSSGPIANTSIRSNTSRAETAAAAAAAPPPPPPPPQTTETTTSTPSIRYRECLRNHAASMGSHVVDGCGEFMPSGEEGTPESLKCAACQCHRNFHRKEIEGEPQQQHHVSNHHHNYYYPNKSNGENRIPSPHLHQFPTPPSSSMHHHRFGGLVPPMMMAFGGGGTESSSEDLNIFPSDGGGQLSVQPPLSSKKRYRTKFTQQQKDSMMEFAEKLGWKIQKHDEQEVQQFCSQVGVKRQVFKVWIHNNKQAMKKKQM